MFIRFFIRDIKFGVEKSKLFFGLIVLFLILPLIGYILFFRNFDKVVNDILLATYYEKHGIIKDNVFFVMLQIFIMLCFSRYVYDDLMMYNKLVLCRYRCRKKLCISKIIFFVITNIFIVTFIVGLISIIFCILNIEISSMDILIKITLNYSIGAISLSLINLLLSIEYSESISFFIVVVFIIVNLLFKIYYFPGGGYISSILTGRKYVISIVYNTLLISLIGIILVEKYKYIDLN